MSVNIVNSSGNNLTYLITNNVVQNLRSTIVVLNMSLFPSSSTTKLPSHSHMSLAPLPGPYHQLIPNLTYSRAWLSIVVVLEDIIPCRLITVGIALRPLRIGQLNHEESVEPHLIPENHLVPSSTSADESLS